MSGVSQRDGELPGAGKPAPRVVFGNSLPSQGGCELGHGLHSDIRGEHPVLGGTGRDE